MPNVGLPELILIELAFAVACGLIARRKGRSPWGWGALGFLFNIITLVILIVLPRSRHLREA